MIARFNVLLEDIDRQIRGLSDAHLLTNERVLHSKAGSVARRREWIMSRCSHT